MNKLFHNRQSDAPLDPKHQQKIAALSLQDSIERAVFLCFLFTVIFGAYGLTSIAFINKYDPSVSIFSNVWPRILFNSLPLLSLGLYLKRAKVSDTKKFYLWTFAFPAIVHASAWIHIWPITLSKNPDVLTYVHSANTYLISYTYAVVAPPGRLLIPFTAAFSVVFLVPLFVVAYLSHDKVIFNLITNDTIFALVSGLLLSQMIHKLRVKIAMLEIEKSDLASKFLGPVVSKAIFDDQSRVLERRKRRGFVVSLDIRDSTELQKQFGERWLDFRKEYFSAVSRAVETHKGYIQKTIGDCHILNFGVIEDQVDLSDVPGLEEEERRAEERRLQHISKHVFACLDEVFDHFQAISGKHFPEKIIKLGAGVDKGEVECAVQGSGSHLEFDVNGDPVNCCSRLQEYSKSIREQFDPECSLLVISPFASDYLMQVELSQFRKLSTLDTPIRNYPQIRWVLAKEFRATQRVTKSNAA